MGSRSVERAGGQPSRVERRLWLASAGWLLLIYSTLYIVRAPVEFLREHNLLRVSVAAVFLLTAATLLLWLLSLRPRRAELVVFAFFLVVYFLAFRSLERAEERIHLIEYGVLAVLVYAALLLRKRRRESERAAAGGLWVPALGAVILTSIAGWLDEVIQGVLPNRVYDLRDAGVNAASAALAVAAAMLWRWTRGRSREVEAK